MQQGSLIRRHRKRDPDVWQFRWADRGPFGKRIYRRRVIGTVCQYPDADSARKSVAGKNTGDVSSAWRNSISCAHFVPTRKWSTFGKFLKRNGGDDETRTRDLCRDRAVLSTWPTQNQLVRCAVVGNRWLRWAWLGVLCATICATFFFSPLVLALSLHDTFSRWVELV